MFFFFNDTATTEIYTLSLHDALPISGTAPRAGGVGPWPCTDSLTPSRCARSWRSPSRSEEHTSELQSQSNLVCRLLLEKKKIQQLNNIYQSSDLLYYLVTIVLTPAHR